ncbi:MAG: hypothetical protein D8M59_05825 [Planctomycetes bacterium]|nr:hypothetical protein [Planctomycetota bacterium]NOG55899.1 hypothetical protein [Planctomycetota bacterium]
MTQPEPSGTPGSTDVHPAQTSETEKLEQQLEEASTSLQTATNRIDLLERQQTIAGALHRAEVVDLELAQYATETALAAMDEPDIEAAVAAVRSQRPYLFRAHAESQQRRTVSTAMAPHAATPAGASTPATIGRHRDEAAAMAVQTGRPQDLLAYLRLRRAPRR